MKYVILLLPVLCLVGCSPRYTQESYPVVPDDLKECKFYSLVGERNSIQVVRCPNSTTSATYIEGKATKTTVTIDGVEYVQK